jgi:hypothetical protein
MIYPYEVGKLYINDKLQDLRYDRNAPYGLDGQTVTFYKILWQLLIGKYSITISKKQPPIKAREIVSLAFDPTENKANV